MLSKNNYKEKIRKMEPRKDRFSIRKFSVGAASVLIGFLFIGTSNGEEVHAEDNSPHDNGNPQQSSGKSVDSQVPKKAQIVTNNTPKDKGNVANLNGQEKAAIKNANSAIDKPEAPKSQTIKSQTSNTKEQTNQPVNKPQDEKTPKQDKASVVNEVKKAQNTQTTDQEKAKTVDTSKLTDIQKSNEDQEKTNLDASKVKDPAATDSALSNNKTKVKLAVPDITKEDSALTNVQNEYKDMQKNFANLSEDERNAATAKFKADYDKLTATQKAAMITGMSINTQLYQVNGDVATVDNFADFTQALIDKNIHTINFTGDVVADDNDTDAGQKALVSGGIGGIFGGGKNGLSPYILTPDQRDVPLISTSPYHGIARTVTINGNNHTLDMGKWSINLVKQNYDQGTQWNITFKDMTLKSKAKNQEMGPFSFNETTGAVNKHISDDDLAKSSLNFENVNAQITNSALTVSDTPVNFSGNNTITVTGAPNDKAAAINGTNVNVADNSSLTITDNAGQDIVAKNFTVGKNAKVNLATITNSKLGNFENNAITTSGNVEIGEGSVLNINTNQQESMIKDVRGIFNHVKDGHVIIGPNATVNMNMGKGHSEAILSDNIDIQNGATLNIKTLQDNNGQLRSGAVGLDVGGAAISGTFPSNPDYCHFAVLSLGWDSSNNTLHVAKDATLKINRPEEVSSIVPFVSFGNASSNKDGTILGTGRVYYFNVDGGATVDFQDAANSKGYKEAGSAKSNSQFIGPKDDVFFPAMIAMYGTNAHDNLNFGTLNEDGSMVPVKYLNLQRTGAQYGNFIKLEGKAVPGGGLTGLIYPKSIQNIANVYGESPIAQWNRANNTADPTFSWVTSRITTQNGGGDTAANYLPANLDGVGAAGFTFNHSQDAITFGDSDGTLIMPSGKSDLQYHNGEVTANDKKGTNEYKFEQFLNNFDWWRPRRIAFGTSLYDAKAKGINIDDSDLYNVDANTLKRVEGQKLANNDFSNTKDPVIADITDQHGTIVQDGLDKIDLSSSVWGVDWTKLKEYADLLDKNTNMPDADKVAALINDSGKSDSQIYTDHAKYNDYQNFIKNIGYPDGSSHDTYDSAAFSNPLKQGNRSVTATVVFKDGSATVINVPVEVAKKLLKDTYQPEYDATTVKQGDSTSTVTPAMMEATKDENGNLTYKLATNVPKATYTLADDHPDFAEINSDTGVITLTPTTDTKVGVYSIPVNVKYANDKSTETVNAIVGVTDDSSKVAFGDKNDDGTYTGAVMVQAQPITAHRTTKNSMRLGDSYAGQSIKSVTVYTPDSKDATKLDSATYTRQTDGSYKNGDTDFGGVNATFGETKPSTVTTESILTPQITVSFSHGSEADTALGSQKGNITVSGKINLKTATAKKDITPITLPEGYDTVNDKGGSVKGKLSSTALGNLINHSDLDNLPEGMTVTGYSLENPSSVSTGKGQVGRTQDAVIRITFADKTGNGVPTYIDVTVPDAIKIDNGEAGQYNPEYGTIIDTTGKLTIAPSWGDKTAPTGASYEITNKGSFADATVDKNGNITIPNTDLTDTKDSNLVVTVTYDDGTVDHAHARVIEVKPEAGVVTDPKGVKQVIKDSSNLDSDVKLTWDENAKPDASKSGDQDVKVNVSAPHAKNATVNAKVNFSDVKDNTTVVYSTDTSTSIHVQEPNYHKTTGDNTPAAPKVDVITTYGPDGKQTDQYTLSGDSYVDAAGNKISVANVTTTWADGAKADTNTSNFGKTGTATSLNGSEAGHKEQQDSTGNSKTQVNITLSGNALRIVGTNSLTSNVYGNYYGATAAKASDANGNLEATHGVASTLKDAANYVDTTDLTAEHNSEIDHVDWKTKPSLDKVTEKSEGTAEICFKDGTVLDIPVSIKVTASEADKFNDNQKKPDTDPTKDVVTQRIEKHVGGAVKADEAISGITPTSKTKYDISGATFNEEVPTTKDKKGTNNYDATVIFGDGSTSSVSIPVYVYDDASKFTDDNTDKNPLTQEVDEKMGSDVPATDAVKGFTQDTIDKYHITTKDENAPKFNSKVDTSKVTETPTDYESTIYFEDGTHTTVEVPVQITDSDASKFTNDNQDNALVQQISHHTTKTQDTSWLNGKDGIKNPDDYNVTGVTFDPTDIQKLDTTKPTKSVVPTYKATVTFQDKTTTEVNIPIKMWDDASKFKEDNAKNPLTQEIDEKMGSVVPATDAIKGFTTDTLNKYKITQTGDDAPKFDESINTSKVTDEAKNYGATIHFEDGTSSTVQIPVKIVGSDASNFQDDNKDNALVKTISWGKGTTHTVDEAINGIKDPDKYNVVAKGTQFTTLPSTEKAHAAENNEATVTFEDGTKLKVQIPVEITDEATTNDKNIKIKTAQVDQGAQDLKPEIVLDDSNKAPEGTKYTWGDKTADTSKPGTQDVTITVNYPDGTSKVKDAHVTVEATPQTQTINLKQGVATTADEAATGITNLKPDGVDGQPKSVAWKGDMPTTDEAGTKNATVTVTYDDGYTKDVTVPVNVWKVTHGSDEKGQTDTNKDIYRDISRKVTVDGKAQSEQHVIFTRDKWTNSTGKDTIVKYSDWTSKNPTFKATDKVTKNGYTTTITGTDAKGNKITLTADGTVPAETITKDEITKDGPKDEVIVVKNSANAQTVTVKYVNAKDESPINVKTSLTFTGDTDSTVTIKKGDLTNIPDGYKLDKSFGDSQSYKFTSTKDQTVTVKLDKLQTLDPGKLTSEDKSKNSDMFETITRTFNYTDPTTGEKKSDSQKVNYQRTKTINLSDATDPAIYGEWTLVSGSDENWKDYDVPQFDDYSVTAKDDQGNDVEITSDNKIKGQDVNAGKNDAKSAGKTKDVTITLTYARTEAGKFKDANKDNALVQQISHHTTPTQDISWLDGKDGIKKSDNYTVSGVSFDPTDIKRLDTTKPTVGTVPTYKATVTFDDHTTAEVNIPIKMWNDASNFNEDNTDKNPLTQEIDRKMGSVVPATDAKDGIKSESITKYGIVTDGDKAPKFNESIDTSKVTESPTDYEATINFKDGSTTTVKIPVKIIASDASKFQDDNKNNALVKTISWGKGSTHQASEAIDGIKDPTTYDVGGASFTTVPSTEKAHVVEPNEATVSFNDGTSLKVQIPVEITDEATENDKNITTKTAQVDQGKSIPADEVVDKTKTNIPDGTKIDWNGDAPSTATPGTKDVTIKLTYPDGTTGTKDGKVTVEATPQTQVITLHQGDEVTNKDAEGGIKNLDKTAAEESGIPTSVTWITAPSTDKTGEVTGTATVGYADGHKVEGVKITANVWKTDKGTDVTKPGDDNNDIYRDISRVVTVDGNKVQDEHVVYTRDRYTNTLDPKATPTYSDWVAKDGKKSFGATDTLTKAGYSVKVEGTDIKGNPAKLTEDGKLAEETVGPDDQSENITVTNTANEDTLTIKYVDATGKDITPETTDTFSGKTDKTINISGDQLKHIPADYKLDKDSGLPNSYKFTSDKDQSITVKLDHLTTTDPTKIEPKDRTKNTDMFETATRTIKYTDPTTNKEVSKDQVVTFGRTKTVNDQDPKDITYGDWKVMDDKADWPAFNVPQFDGHYDISAKDNRGDAVTIDDKNQIAKFTPVAGDKDGNGKTADQTITITYTRNEAGKFQDANKDNALVQTITWGKGTSHTVDEAINGIKDPDSYGVAKEGTKFNTLPSTDEIHDAEPQAATVSFKDGSTLDVQIPVKITDDASDDKDTQGKTIYIPVDPSQTPKLPDPSKGVTNPKDDNKYTWDPDDTPTIPDPGEKPNPGKVIVTYPDGTKKTVDTEVASDYNPTIGSLTTPRIIVPDLTDDKNAHAAIINLGKGKGYPTAVSWVNVPDVSQTGDTTGQAKVMYENGYETTVTIPVKVTASDADNFHKADQDPTDPDHNALTQEIDVHKNSEVQPTDAIKGIQQASKDKFHVTGAVFNGHVATDEVGTTNHAATVHFADGSQCDVTIPVYVYTDASRFNRDNGKNPIAQTVTETVGQPAPKTDAFTKGFSDQSKSKYGIVASNDDGNKTEFTDIDTSKPVTGEHYKATVAFEDGTSTTVNIPVDVTNGNQDSDHFDINTLKPIMVHKGDEIKAGDKTPDSIIDSKDKTREKVTHITYVNPVDTTKTGEQDDVSIKITFEDGSTKTSKTNVTVVSDADEFNPENIKQPSYIHNVDKPTADNGKDALDPKTPNIKNVTYTDPVETNYITDKQPNHIKITFDDGSTKNVPVNVKIVPSDADKTDLDKYKRPINIDQAKTLPDNSPAKDPNNGFKDLLDTITKVEYVTPENPVDPTKEGEQDPEVKVTFKDGSTKTTRIEVDVTNNTKGTKYDPNSTEDNKYVTRIFKVKDPTTNEVKVITQKVHFARCDAKGNSSYTDPVTNEKKDVDWVVYDDVNNKATNKTKAHWDTVKLPDFANYKLAKDLSGDIKDTAVTPDTKSETIDVTYNFNMDTVNMMYVVPDSITSNDSAFLQLRATDKKTGKLVKIPKEVLFASLFALPSEASMDAQGNLKVTEGMPAGTQNFTVRATDNAGQTKDIKASLVVKNPQPSQPADKGDQGQTTPQQPEPTTPQPVTPEVPQPTTPTEPTKPSQPTESNKQTEPTTPTPSIDTQPSTTDDQTEKKPKKTVVPVAKKLLKTKVNVLPKPVKGIKNKAKLPAGTKYTWVKKPNIKRQGLVKAKIRVTYPNGKKYVVKTKLAVGDIHYVEITHHPSTTQGHLPSADSMIDDMPEGARAHWIKKPDVNKPGTSKGVIGIKYPDGYHAKKNVFITVKPGNSLSSNEPRNAKHQKSSYNRNIKPQHETYNSSSNSPLATSLARVGLKGQLNVRPHAYEGTQSATDNTTSANNVKKSTNSGELPATGEADNAANILGLLATGLSMIGLAGVRKRNKH